MKTCAYCQNHPRFIIFARNTAGYLVPDRLTCGDHLTMGVDESLFDTPDPDVTVKALTPS